MDDATRAYIAGFLDGDGSIIFQLVRRADYVYGYQIRASVCFYQNTRGRAGLEWLKGQLGCGYIRDRAGSMSDYTIVGWLGVKRVLELVRPYTVFKRQQVERALDILDRLDGQLTPARLVELAKAVDAFAVLNYSKRKVLDATCVEQHLVSMGLLVPVTTEALSEPRSRATASRYPRGKSTAVITRQLPETG
jgi:hypothetical protein